MEVSITSPPKEQRNQTMLSLFQIASHSNSNPLSKITALQLLSQNLINMIDSSENFDNFPIMNSFLTTIQEYSTVEPPKEPAQPLSKQADEWFQAEAKLLQARKERELAKQNRLRQLEEQFQAQRVKKQKELQEKLASIEKNKMRNLNHIQEKFHKISLRHNKVLVRIQDENLKEMEKNYDSRKAYEIETSRRSSKMINTSQQSSNEDRHKSLKDYKIKTVEQEDVRQRMNTIDNRLEKAKTMYKQRQEETVNKVRNHNVYDLFQAQTRAKEQFDEYLKMYATKIMNKMESAEYQKDKMEKQMQKKNEEKQKSYGEKLKRIHNNLTQLQEQKEMKFQQLSKKLQKTNSIEKGGRDTRETHYLKKFRGNLQQLQKEKVQRANQIIQKHQQISLKNRLFKERKQSLYRTLKVEVE